MTEPTYVRQTKINWSSALIAGLIATVVITITMAIFGQNIMKMLGSTMLGEDASVGAQYLVGGMFHLMVGLIWGVLYAWLFGPVRVWNPLLKGIVYGLAITAIALATMPIMMAMMGGGGAGNPCAANPCAAGNPCAAANPCAEAPGNPCQPSDVAGNPCNPCAANASSSPDHAGNPCNPCAAKAASNPCAAKAGSNPCSASAGNPCNPCGGSGGDTYSAMISLINHLVFALALAFIYRPRVAE